MKDRIGSRWAVDELIEDERCLDSVAGGLRRREMPPPSSRDRGRSREDALLLQVVKPNGGGGDDIVDSFPKPAAGRRADA
jgi:predicted subunit of tRNA(5-methylaminomethyl-2-thiouridylate) methyltransferase